MNDLTEADIVREFRERVARGETSGIGVLYRVSGGMPGEQHVSKYLTVAGTGRAHARSENSKQPPREASSSLDEVQIQELFQKLSDGVDALIPRSEARFLPDSVVGSVTIEIYGNEATLFFLADEEERASQGKTISGEAAAALNDFSRLTRQLLDR